MLKQCHREMVGKKAGDVDQMTKEEYEANPYKPLPVRVSIFLRQDQI